MYYLQDLASQVPALVLAPRASEVVVDCCASPGGKTTQLAALMGNSGQLVAMESREDRLAPLTANLERMGVLNCAVLHTDSRNIADYDLTIDAILLDAPCTGEGVIGKDPARKTSRGLEDITECSVVQRELLDAALDDLALGGRLVYSTCSFAPEENELVIDHALEHHDVNLGKIQWGEPGLTHFCDYKFDPRLNLARRFYPHIHNSQGFFIALLEKGES
jgi:NOL1/NOP2/sun family putative RNA methylase